MKGDFRLTHIINNHRENCSHSLLHSKQVSGMTAVKADLSHKQKVEYLVCRTVPTQILIIIGAPYCYNSLMRSNCNFFLMKIGEKSVIYCNKHWISVCIELLYV